MAAEKPVDIRFTPRCIPENWDDLDALVDKDVVMNPDQKSDYFSVRSESNPDVREARMKNQAYYRYMKETLYPKLRTVKFNCYLHRKGMIKDTVHTTVLDSTYMRGVQELRDMNYAEALALLIPYDDFNTAVAYVGMDRNVNAMRILSKLEKTAQVNYLMAILYSRSGDLNNAVQHYVTSCRQNPSCQFRAIIIPTQTAMIAFSTSHRMTIRVSGPPKVRWKLVRPALPLPWVRTSSWRIYLDTITAPLKQPQK